MKWGVIELDGSWIDVKRKAPRGRFEAAIQTQINKRNQESMGSK